MTAKPARVFPVSPPEVRGMQPGEPGRCMGCAMPEGGRHRCTGDKPMQPYGGWCICREPTCGPGLEPDPLPATPRPVRRRRGTS